MAVNAFDALVSDVNKKLSEMNTASSEANGAAARASEAVTEAGKQSAAAGAAAEKATQAAAEANELSALWEGVTVEVTTLDAGSEATVALTEEEGKKKITFGVPRGATGAQGAKGDTGKSGVSFRYDDAKLYITTN